MDIRQMKEIIQAGEGVTIEFKEATNELSMSALETIVAFLNQRGGYCIFGVSDNKEIIGVNEEAAPKIKDDFTVLVNNPQKINPPIPLLLEDMYIDGKLILYVNVPESSTIHKYNNSIIYLRSTSGDVDITKNSSAYETLILRKRGKRDEDLVYKDLTLADFDDETIKKACKLASLEDKNSDWKNLSSEELLKSPWFYKQDSITGEKGYTLAALLLFGKKDSIAKYFSWYKVDVIKCFKDQERFDDRYICDENLINSFEALQDYINEKIDHPFYLNDKGVRYNAVGVVVREIVGNLLIHRNFMSGDTPKIILYKDKLVAKNPNVYRNYMSLDVNSIEPYSKNPTIAKVFRKIGYADELGSGVRKINDACIHYFKSKPLFEDKDFFTVEISFESEEQPQKEKECQEQKIIQYIKENGSINNGQCRSLLNVEKTKAFKLITILMDDKKIKRIGNGRSTYYVLI